MLFFSYSVFHLPKKGNVRVNEINQMFLYYRLLGITTNNHTHTNTHTNTHADTHTQINTLLNVGYPAGCAGFGGT